MFFQSFAVLLCFRQASFTTGKVFDDLVKYLKSSAAESLELLILENCVALSDPPKKAPTKKNTEDEKDAEAPVNEFTNLDYCVAKLLDSGFVTAVLQVDPRLVGTLICARVNGTSRTSVYDFGVWLQCDYVIDSLS